MRPESSMPADYDPRNSSLVQRKPSRNAAPFLYRAHTSTAATGDLIIHLLQTPSGNNVGGRRSESAEKYRALSMRLDFDGNGHAFLSGQKNDGTVLGAPDSQLPDEAPWR